jgi:hypothetical protein
VADDLEREVGVVEMSIAVRRADHATFAQA